MYSPRSCAVALAVQLCSWVRVAKASKLADGKWLHCVTQDLCA